MSVGDPPVRPLWIVCEDGSEYIERYARFLDGEFAFAAAGDAAEVMSVAGERKPGGVILDLDFRRTPPERLVDEEGRTRDALPEAERRRLAASQGLLILRALRARGLATPVILCADLDDAEQIAWLTETYAPLAIVPSHEGLVETAARMRAFR